MAVPFGPTRTALPGPTPRSSDALNWPSPGLPRSLIMAVAHHRTGTTPSLDDSVDVSRGVGKALIEGKASLFASACPVLLVPRQVQLGCGVEGILSQLAEIGAVDTRRTRHIAAVAFARCL